MVCGTLDVDETFRSTGIVYVVFHQVDEARDGGGRSLDVVGDGEEEMLTLLHDAAYLLVGILQVLSVDALLLGISPDVPKQDDGGDDGDNGQQTYLPQKVLASFHRLVDGLLHGVTFPLVNLVELLGGAQGQLGIYHLQVFHLLGYGLRVVLGGGLFLSVDLFEDVGYVLRHVHRCGDGVDDGVVAVSLDAERLCVFLLEGIGEAAKESLACLHYLHCRVLGFVGLLGFGMNHDGVLAIVEAIHLFTEVVLVAFPFECCGELVQVGLLFLEQCRHGAVGGITLLDVFTGCLVDSEYRLRVAVHEADGEDEYGGDGAIACCYLEREMILLHVASLTCFGL